MSQPKVEKILVVEDDPFSRQLLVEELEGLGYAAIAVDNGQQAVQTAREIGPDLILLDIMMEGVDGYQVCKALRQDPWSMHIPIIFVTAKGSNQDLVKGLSFGANDYVVKPFNVEVLAARIETQLRVKRLLDEVSAQKAELEGLNETIKEFLGTASHDLRTPASVIKLMTETMLDEITGPLTDAQRSLMEKMRLQNSHMVDMLDSLLNISHIQSGKIVLHIRPHDLNRILHDNLSALAVLAKKKKIELDLETDSSLPPIPLDKTRFTEVMDNLVSNAIKFTPEGGQIRVRSFRDNGQWACVAVADTGMGMDQGTMQRLFQQYSTGAGGTKGEKSTGLGLWIAKRLVELHRGVLQVKSEAGAGTEFTVQLPLPVKS